MRDTGEPPLIRVRRLPHAVNGLPRRMTEGSAGFDLPAAIEKPLKIRRHRHVTIPTGYVFELPEDHEGQVRSRSGLAARHGIAVLNAPGTVDADYRGEVKVVLVNHGRKTFIVNPGDRIAQMVVQRVARVRLKETHELSSSARGSGGFGSTGVADDRDAA